MASTSFVVHRHPEGFLPDHLLPGGTKRPRWPQRLSEAQRTSSTPIEWQPFVYDPLEEQLIQIRWLLVYPGVLGEPVFMQINTPSPGHFPYYNYRCLSYVWGNDSAEYQVILNGRAFHVRKNLNQFLQMASRRPGLMRDSGTGLWIDAMCIDQGNDFEKGNQVKKMGEIYRYAKQTIIWLGGDPEINAAVQEVAACNWKKGDISGLASLNVLCGHEYWNRTWVTQEVLTSISIVIMSTKHELSWELFGAAIETCLRRNKIRESSATVFWYMWNEAHHKRHKIPPHPSTPPHNHLLWDLLLWRMSSSCMDARDRIYAMVSMTGDGISIVRQDYSVRFPINYKESVVDLFWRAGSYYSAWTRVDLIILLMQTLRLTERDIAASVEMDPKLEITIPIKRAERLHRWTSLGTKKVACSCKACKKQPYNIPPSSESRYEYILCTQLYMPKHEDKQCVHLLVRQHVYEGQANGSLETALLIPYHDDDPPVFHHNQPLEVNLYTWGGHNGDGWFQLTDWAKATEHFKNYMMLDRRLLRLKLPASFALRMLQHELKRSGVSQPVFV